MKTVFFLKKVCFCSIIIIIILIAEQKWAKNKTKKQKRLMVLFPSNKIRFTLNYVDL